MTLTAPQVAVVEIFSGIQGEGLLVGLRQLFLRFHGCHLACRYCDTPASRGEAPATCRVEQAPGSRSIEHLANPLTIAEIIMQLQRLQVEYPHHSVSLTGGEPLLHVAFLNALLPALQPINLPAYLETNGQLPEALQALKKLPDYIAMDIKLPSASGEAPAWEQHAAFLDVLLTRWQESISLSERIQVKLIFTEDSLEDIANAAQLIAAYRTDLPCVLQPVTQQPGGPPAPSPGTVLEAQRIAAASLRHVRVIPQVHVLMGQW